MDIPPERVPAGTQILFRRPGLWQSNRNFVLAALAAVLLQAALIAGLLLQLRRRQRAEADLRQAQATLRLAVDALPISVLMVNQRGAIVFANPPAEKLLGYGAGELAGRLADELVPERLRGAQGWQRAAFFTAAKRELAARRKDGSEVAVEIVLDQIQSARNGWCLPRWSTSARGRNCSASSRSSSTSPACPPWARSPAPWRTS